MRALVLVLAALLLSAGASPVSAQPANKAEADVIAEMRMVHEYIDLGDYKIARDTLIKSLHTLKSAGSAARPIAAQTHAKLGVVYILGFKNTDKASEHFASAIHIQKDITLPQFANTRAKLVFGRAYEEMYPTIDCDKLVGVFHKPVPLAQEGAGTIVEAKLGKHLVGGPMLILYRDAASGDFKEAVMEKVEGCTFQGTIPGESVSAPSMNYYLEARLKDGRPSARRATAKSPYTVNVSFGPVANAPVVAEPVVAEPEPVVVAPERPKTDEVEELLLTKPKGPKGSGCAGCATTHSGSNVGWLMLLGVLWGLGRRRQR